MKFGKQMRALVVPEWESQYLEYKGLKQLIRLIKQAQAQRLKNLRARLKTLDDVKSGTSSQGLRSDKKESDLAEKFQTRFGDDIQSHSFGSSNLLDHSTQASDSSSTGPGSSGRGKQLWGKTRVILKTVRRPSTLLRAPSVALDVETHRFFDTVRIQLQRAEAFYLIKEKEGQETLEGLRVQAESIATFDEKSRQVTSKILTEAFVEFYRFLELLESFRAVNLTAFEKIMKKYDKATRTDRGKRFLIFQTQSEIPSSFFKPSRLAEIKKETEALVANMLTGGQRRPALSTLRISPPPDWTPADLFREGLYIGLAVIPMLLVFLLAPDASVAQGRELMWLQIFFPLYRLLLMTVVATWLYGVTVYVMSVVRINHRFILNVPWKAFISHHAIWQTAALLTALSITSYWLFEACVLDTIELVEHVPPVVFPSTLLVSLTAIVLVPPSLSVWGNVVDYPLMTWLFTGLFRVITAPFHALRMQDFYLGDQLTSTVIILNDLRYTTCLFASAAVYRIRSNTSPWTHDAKSAQAMWESVSESCDVNSKGVAAAVVAMLPFWFRFLQCLRRYVSMRPDSTQLWNAFKYVSAMLVVIFQFLFAATWLSQEAQDALWYCWLAVGVVSTVFKTYWDIVCDWGFFTPNAKHKLLRDELMFDSTGIYYVAIVLNILLRVSWLFSISLDIFGVSLNQQYLKLIIASGELFRRAMWNVFRLENEHLNNCGKFRAADVRVPQLIHFREKELHLFHRTGLLDPSSPISARAAALSDLVRRAFCVTQEAPTPREGSSSLHTSEDMGIELRSLRSAKPVSFEILDSLDRTFSTGKAM